jgi:hypothetical protein
MMGMIVNRANAQALPPAPPSSDIPMSILTERLPPDYAEGEKLPRSPAGERSASSVFAEEDWLKESGQPRRDEAASEDMRRRHEEEQLRKRAGVPKQRNI